MSGIASNGVSPPLGLNVRHSILRLIDHFEDRYVQLVHQLEDKDEEIRILKRELMYYHQLLYERELMLDCYRDEEIGPDYGERSLVTVERH